MAAVAIASAGSASAPSACRSITPPPSVRQTVCSWAPPSPMLSGGQQPPRLCHGLPQAAVTPLTSTRQLGGPLTSGFAISPWPVSSPGSRHTSPLPRHSGCAGIAMPLPLPVQGLRGRPPPPTASAVPVVSARASWTSIVTASTAPAPMVGVLSSAGVGVQRQPSAPLPGPCCATAVSVALGSSCGTRSPARMTVQAEPIAIGTRSASPQQQWRPISGQAADPFPSPSVHPRQRSQSPLPGANAAAPMSPVRSVASARSVGSAASLLPQALVTGIASPRGTGRGLMPGVPVACVVGAMPSALTAAVPMLSVRRARSLTPPPVAQEPVASGGGGLRMAGAGGPLRCGSLGRILDAGVVQASGRTASPRVAQVRVAPTAQMLQLGPPAVRQQLQRSLPGWPILGHSPSSEPVASSASRTGLQATASSGSRTAGGPTSPGRSRTGVSSSAASPRRVASASALPVAAEALGLQLPPPPRVARAGPPPRTSVETMGRSASAGRGLISARGSGGGAALAAPHSSRSIASGPPVSGRSASALPSRPAVSPALSARPARQQPPPPPRRGPAGNVQRMQTAPCNLGSPGHRLRPGGGGNGGTAASAADVTPVAVTIVPASAVAASKATPSASWQPCTLAPGGRDGRSEPPSMSPPPRVRAASASLPEPAYALTAPPPPPQSPMPPTPAPSPSFPVHTGLSMPPAPASPLAPVARKLDLQKRPHERYACGEEVQIGGLVFRCRRVLGRGSFSEVWSGQAFDNVEAPLEAALKDILCLNSTELQQAEFEAKLLKTFRSHAAFIPGQGAPTMRIPRYLGHTVEDLANGGWRLRMAMTRVPGECLDSFLVRSAADARQGPSMDGRVALKRGVILASGLVRQLGPTLDLIAPLAWHRDVNSHNVLVTDGLDGTRLHSGSEPEDSARRASFWLIDFGLAVDRPTWPDSWPHADVAGDCRYWPPSSFVMSFYGPEDIITNQGLTEQYKTRLDVAGLGLTALELLCSTALAGLHAWGPAGPNACLRELLTAWETYWTEVTRWHSMIFRVFADGGDIGALYQQLGQEHVVSRVHDHIVRIRNLLRACIPHSQDVEERSIMAVIADMIDENSTVGVLEAVKALGPEVRRSAARAAPSSGGSVSTVAAMPVTSAPSPAATAAVLVTAAMPSPVSPLRPSPQTSLATGAVTARALAASPSVTSPLRSPPPPPPRSATPSRLTAATVTVPDLHRRPSPAERSPQADARRTTLATATPRQESPLQARWVPTVAGTTLGLAATAPAAVLNPSLGRTPSPCLITRTSSPMQITTARKLILQPAAVAPSPAVRRLQQGTPPPAAKLRLGVDLLAASAAAAAAQARMCTTAWQNVGPSALCTVPRYAGA